ncbi:DUF3290 family protein [Fructilactobacillus florum]|uniref:DUF3290 family protein n=1 Tax=Fructilactobacillus florum TaxID=640331 RepID=UPI000A50CCAC|nr:DUF3290 family protein [Fructilactobacillus florum]
MNLYSYQYLIHNFSASNYLFIGLVILIATIISCTAFFYYRNRNNPRFRNLLVLVSLIGALIIVMQTGQFLEQQNSDTKTGQTVTVLKKIAKEKQVPLNQMYASSNNLSDGMTIQAGNHYFVLHFNNDLSNYRLEPVKLVSSPKHINKSSFSLTSIIDNNNDYGTVALKFIVGFIMIVLQINLSGKGNLAPSNAVDQLQNYILGGIIGGVIYNPQITVMQFAVILLIWAVIVFTAKFLTGQSNLLNRFINGNPQVLIDNGQVNVTRSLQSGINANELAFKLRTHGITSVKDVKNATLEQNGQLTVTTYDDESVNYPIITDGQINKAVLDHQKLTETQLEEMLAQHHTRLEDIYMHNL